MPYAAGSMRKRQLDALVKFAQTLVTTGTLPEADVAALPQRRF